MKLIRALNQSEIYFHHLHQSCKGLYQVFIKFGIQGQLDQNRLNKALQQVVAKNPVLNSRIIRVKQDYFFCKNDSSVQIIYLSKKHAQHWLMVATKECLKPLNSTSGPLFKLYVLISENGEPHDFLGIFHHSVIDQDSFFIFLNDLLQAYDGNLIPTPISDEKRVISAGGSVKSKIKIPDFDAYFPEVKCNFFKKVNTAIRNSLRKLKDRTEKPANLFTLILPETQTTTILEHCKQKQINLFSLVTALFADCIKEHHTGMFKLKVLLGLVNDNKEMGCRVGFFNRLKSHAELKNKVWLLAAYYQQVVESIKPNIEQFAPKIPKQLFLQKIYFLFLKFKFFFKNLFKLGDGLCLVTVLNKKQTVSSRELKVVSGHWSGNYLYDTRQKFYIGVLVLNGQLNITFFANLDDAQTETIKSKILDFFNSSMTSD